MQKGICVALLVAAFLTGWSQSATPALEQKRILLDSMITTWYNHGIFNGGVLIKQNEKLLYQRCAGYANFEKEQPNTSATAFNLASVSKPFTGVAVLQLVNRKKIKLTDLFVNYFPGFPYRSVTIEQLLSHTSGLPEADQFEKTYIQSHPDEVLSNQQIYDDLERLKVPSLADAGQKHFYNNLNYILLGLLVEKVSQTSFQSYMKKNIFDKAGMKHSYVRQRISPNTSRYIRATFYDSIYQHVDSISNKKIYTDHSLGGTYGDNNIITTLEDMALFDNALNKGKLLPHALLKQMYKPVMLANGNYFFNGGTRTYTLGWNVNEKNAAGQFVAWHDGSLVGLTTMLFKNFTDSITYILFENRNYPGFFRRYLAIANVIENNKPAEVSLKKSIVREAYGPVLVTKGADFALALLNTLKKDTAWYLDVNEMNELGYHLLYKSELGNHKALAVEVFRINTLLAPENANIYDSYAEGLLSLGLKEAAILTYKKILLLDPKNESAKNKLDALTK
ncbi:MAG TPA: serine hydrolase domain-containing protein [Ferruginibacter sp.]|nr:serine hydrolase domain-containing protein [Ferruginibacter sp.]HMP21197.1 serine hydrolase domain-containing protein [Ferruginibacter sp.]